jgi:hypothetical protein
MSGVASNHVKVDSPTTQQPTAAPAQPLSPRAADGRYASRCRSLELVAEAQGDVDSFVKEIDQKRRQLDDQIHKFISQKEREFKLYERELRTRYRTPSNPSAPAPLSPTASDETLHAVQVKEDAESPSKKSHERETELLGLFTPAYLPLLDSRPPAPARSPSAPPRTDTAASSDNLGPDRQALHRASTDPAGHASADRPHSIRMALGPRTPSSGSDPGRSLVSALKSPSAGPKVFNKKRVSLIVGDAVVAPSDNIHSATQELSLEEQSATQRVEKQSSPQPACQPDAIKSSLIHKPSSNTCRNIQTNPQPGGLSLGFASASQAPSVFNEATPTNINAIDAEGDLDLASPFSMDEEIDNMATSEMYTTQIEDIDADVDSGLDSGLDSESTLRGASAEAKGISPTSPLISAESPVAKIEASSSASAQPISPGFSRPSVQQDPQLEFADQIAQDTIPPNSLYGSFSRPTYGMQQTSGSLGESFMARNAEKLMRRRQSTQRS